jgi:RHS repeat-associated protein
MTTAAICATREVSWRPSFYRGEQYDSDLALYYLRARYYNPQTGRFLSRDPEDGKILDPATLHKYLYAGGDPINRWDSTGRDFLGYVIQIAQEHVVILAIGIPTSACVVYGIKEEFGSPGMPTGREKSFVGKFCSVLGAVALALAIASLGGG